MVEVYLFLYFATQFPWHHLRFEDAHTRLPFLFKIKKDIMLIIIILKPTIDSIIDSLNEKYNIQMFAIKYKIGTNG